jgi:plasmid stabilization system protein ParE
LSKPTYGIESVTPNLQIAKRCCKADRWFRGLMNAIATLQEKPRRCALAVEHEIFPEQVRQLLYGKSKNIYRVLFTIRDTTVYVLYVRHIAQAPLTINDLDDLEGGV